MKALLIAAIAFSLFFNMNVYADDSITISAVGDIMMGSAYPKKALPPNDGEGIFDGVSEWLKGADIVFGNLEGPLTERRKASKCKGGENCYEFKTPKKYVKHLEKAGFNVMSIANNHATDFGEKGAKDTIKTLKSAGIKAVGGTEVAFLDAKGKKIAVIGFSFSDSPYSHPIEDIDYAKGLIQCLKASNDIVIVSFHGGAEGSKALHIREGVETFLSENRGDVIGFSRGAVEAGADIVIGHGPHVLRAMEVYKGKLIAYSLGNFLTYGMFNIKGPNGLSVVLRASMDKDTGDFIGGELIPVRLVGEGIPEPDPGKEAVKLIKMLTNEDLKSPNLAIADSGGLVPSEAIAKAPSEK